MADQSLSEQTHRHMLGLPGAWLDRPFGPDVDVYKVQKKVFALQAQRLEHVEISLKIEPGFGEVLRQNYPAITAGYHLNKKHWITVQLDGSLSVDELKKLMDHSYDRVRSSLTRAERAELDQRSGS